MKSRVVALVLPVAVVIEGAVLVACWWAANLPQHTPATQFAIAQDVAVDVAAGNSKVYYVIVESPAGDQVYRYPCADQVTVLDAVSRIPNFRGIASKKVWVQRPSLNQTRDKVLSVDWQAIVRQQNTSTDFALQSGDRVYVADRGSVPR